MRILWTTALASIAIAIAAANVSADVIYVEDFDGVGGALNGAASTVDNNGGGNAWITVAGFLDDGTVQSGHGSALLPFAPQNGAVYEMSATLTNVNSPDTVGDWIALGFARQASTTTSNQNRFSNSGADGYAWLLTRNLSTGTDQEMFTGPRTSGPFTGVSGDIVDATQPIDVKIVLNTTAATWTAEYFLNGVSRGTQNLPASANTDIAFAGFSRSKSSTTNIPMLDNFKLERVPEPGAVVLAGLALCGVAVGRVRLMRRR